MNGGAITCLAPADAESAPQFAQLISRPPPAFLLLQHTTENIIHQHPARQILPSTSPHPPSGQLPYNSTPHSQHQNITMDNSRLGKLAAELRNSIWQLSLQEEECIELTAAWDVSESACKLERAHSQPYTALLKTCKAIHSETLSTTVAVSMIRSYGRR